MIVNIICMSAIIIATGIYAIVCNHLFGKVDKPLIIVAGVILLIMAIIIALPVPQTH